MRTRVCVCDMLQKFLASGRDVRGRSPSFHRANARFILRDVRLRVALQKIKLSMDVRKLGRKGSSVEKKWKKEKKK